MSNLWLFATLTLWVLLILLGFVTLGVLRRVVGVLEQVEGRWAADSESTFLGDGTRIRSAVKRLRRKLQARQITINIEAVRGVGFRLSLADGQPAGPDSVVLGTH